MQPDQLAPGTVTDAPIESEGIRLLALPTRKEALNLGKPEKAAVAVVSALIASIAAIGFVNSFAAVQRAAEPAMGNLAYTLPLGVDLGILAFTALDVLLARLDMRLAWLRTISWGLTGATIYLNIQDQTTLFGCVVHTVLPMLWVAGVEVSAWIIKKRVGLTTGQAMDSIRLSRWLLSPWRTFLLRRRMILWEIRSYPLALQRERQRILALTDLQDGYGRIKWRWKAPRRVRAMHRLGDLIPMSVQTTALADEASAPTADEQNLEVVEIAEQGNALPQDLIDFGRQVRQDHADAGQELTRDSLRAGLRAADRTASNHRVGLLLSFLRAE